MGALRLHPAACRGSRRGDRAGLELAQIVRRSCRSAAAVAVQVGGGVRTAKRVEELLDAGARAGGRRHARARGAGVARRAGVASSRARSSSLPTCASGGSRRAAGRARCRIDILDVRRGAERAAARRPARDRGAPGRTDAGHRSAADGGCRAKRRTFPCTRRAASRRCSDLRALEHRGVAGAVIGMALYTGALDPVVVAEEFGE